VKREAGKDSVREDAKREKDGKKKWYKGQGQLAFVRDRGEGKQ